MLRRRTTRMSKIITSTFLNGVPYENSNDKRSKGPIPINAKDSAIFYGQTVKFMLSDLKTHLLEWISKQECVVGCVAWLTNKEILEALPKKCCIVMQKEDWLRPDYDGSHPAQYSKNLYTGPSSLYRQDFSGLDCMNSSCYKPIDKFRLFGVAVEGKYGRPLMHHKFMIGMESYNEKKVCEIGEYENRRYRPISVWAGSFNMSKGSVRNCDMTFIAGSEVAAFFYNESS